jgi:hypothetical protein
MIPRIYERLLTRAYTNDLLNLVAFFRQSILRCRSCVIVGVEMWVRYLSGSHHFENEILHSKQSSQRQDEEITGLSLLYQLLQSVICSLAGTLVRCTSERQFWHIVRRSYSNFCKKLLRNDAQVLRNLLIFFSASMTLASSLSTLDGGNNPCACYHKSCNRNHRYIRVRICRRRHYPSCNPHCTCRHNDRMAGVWRHPFRSHHIHSMRPAGRKCNTCRKRPRRFHSGMNLHYRTHI